MDYKKIKSFEAACKALGVSSELPDVSAFAESLRKSVLTHYQLMLIAQALNGDWAPDWEDYDQYKYYPWFTMGAADGSGFSFGSVDCNSSLSDLGSRLCFRSSDIARHAGTQFTELYKQYFLAQQ